MKLDRDDPDYPRGMAWVTKEDLPKVQGVVEWKGKGMTRCTITRKYVEFAKRFGADSTYLEQLDKKLELVLPKWAIHKTKQKQIKWK